MKGRRRVESAWWVIAGCGLALITVFLYASFWGWTPRKVERLVNQELPPGSDRAVIEAFLDARGWVRCSGGPENTTTIYAEWARLHPSEVQPVRGFIAGEVPDPNVGPFVTGTITVMLFLDPDGRLIRSWVKTLTHGL